jgi:hypothetical protein
MNKSELIDAMAKDAGIFWHWFGWQGVVGTGITLATCSFMINIFSKK